MRLMAQAFRSIFVEDGSEDGSAVLPILYSIRLVFEITGVKACKQGVLGRGEMDGMFPG